LHTEFYRLSIILLAEGVTLLKSGGSVQTDLQAIFDETKKIK